MSVNKFWMTILFYLQNSGAMEQCMVCWLFISEVTKQRDVWGKCKQHGETLMKSSKIKTTLKTFSSI